MSARIKQCFDALNGRTALLPFITAGDPDLETTLALMHQLVKSGANLIELGVPFSDPMADGPVIQAASERALANGVRLVDVIDLVARFRTEDSTTPVVLMGYMNPVETLGSSELVRRCEQAGVDGLLTVDLPPEEASELAEALRQVDIDMIFLLSPTTPDHRIAEVARLAGGYIYYVSLKGVTGASTLDSAEVSARVQHLKQHVNLPIAVGFGISDAASAARIGADADGVVVGSALVRTIADTPAGDQDALLANVDKLIGGMRAAMDR